ncbi:MAG: extracellular solute-binding protein [Proteobacteria bacterium]|nr:extracellular solute-binding protein [Pseudomonadota bacterium]
MASAELPGKFPGVSIGAKLIGGTQYEGLYKRIALWEKATGAKVTVFSKKSHFEIDKEIKSDMAAGTTEWCVGSNHTSFAPQYEGLYVDLSKHIPAYATAGYVPAILKAGFVKGAQVMLPRAQFDVSVMYYQKSLFADAKNKRNFKAKYGYELMPPDTLDQWKDQAIFFSNPPDFYGTQYAGKDEAIVGRFYEIVVAEGGSYLDSKMKPAFNSPAGQRALQWFVDLYKAKAVPKGTLSYVWDELGAGFASGTVALNLDWPGWAGYFNDPKNSKVAGNLGVALQPKGSSGKRTGWSGSHGFSVTQKCANKDAAASLVWFLTNSESQFSEAKNGSLPTRTAVWGQVLDLHKKNNNTFMIEAVTAFSEGAKHAFPVPAIPEWGESTNIVFPELQAAILGDKTVKEALDSAAKGVEEMLEENGYY